ncbi:MAG: hypothetical protein HYU36_10410 [Planctomycetes bacterium]|nr:hypothetical protein [Planctomycetota bacterium]
MPAVKRGVEGEPLPGEEVVFRLWRKGKDGTRDELVAAFELSSDERRSLRPTLSVFAEGLTSHEQAFEITGKNSLKRLVLRMQVCEIRKIDLVPPDLNFRGLDVIWVQAKLQENGREVPDERPGAEGHAGILGLSSPPNKNSRKVLRVKLAELAYHNDPFDKR